MASKLPKLVLALTHSHDAWIVGSAANPDIENPRDYDIIVPFSEWQKASSLIPKDAKVNKFGGFKCIDDEIEIDVWAGDIGWLMQRPMSKFIWHVASGIRYKKYE